VLELRYLTCLIHLEVTTETTRGPFDCKSPLDRFVKINWDVVVDKVNVISKRQHE
jgi:hypothetical protein